MRYKVGVLIFLLIFLSLVLSSPTSSNETKPDSKVIRGRREEEASVVKDDNFSDGGGQQWSLPVCEVTTGANILPSIRTPSSSRSALSCESGET